jgi:hypothetical protein
MLTIVAFLGACVTTLRPEGPGRVDERRQFVKNYTIGQQITVNVGDPMIKFQDYELKLETIESPVVTPERTVNLRGGVVNITLTAGQKYPVRGRMLVNGIDYVVVGTTDHPVHFRAVLVKPDGTLHNRVAFYNPNLGGLQLVFYTFTLSDPSTRIIRDTTQNVKSTKGYQNFEILYSGINTNGLNLTYREFSPDGLARVAFFQNLSYEANAKTITFKSYRIAIERASSEAITFTVLADGTD